MNPALTFGILQAFVFVAFVAVAVRSADTTSGACG